MVKLTINGKVVEAQEGEFLLTVMKRMNIEVPALCDHEAVEPFGACRLCTVEITKKSWDGWKGYVTSCLYPVEQDLIVNTHSEKVLEIRRTLIDLLVARCPNSPEIRKLAEEYGIMGTSFETIPNGDNCILCGLCTRVCEKMGFAAISTVNRGHNKMVAPPLKEQPPDCVGCLSCAKVCPTNVISYTDNDDKRVIWDKEFELMHCEECGRATVTKDFAKALSQKQGISPNYFKKCDACHRKDIARTMGGIVSWSREEVA